MVPLLLLLLPVVLLLRSSPLADAWALLLALWERRSKRLAAVRTADVAGSWRASLGALGGGTTISKLTSASFTSTLLITRDMTRPNR